jgi:hypothetical protein
MLAAAANARPINKHFCHDVFSPKTGADASSLAAVHITNEERH